MLTSGVSTGHFLFILVVLAMAGTAVLLLLSLRWPARQPEADSEFDTALRRGADIQARMGEDA